MTQAVTYRSAAARAPVTAAGHWWPVPLQETLKHRKYRLVQSLWYLWVLVCKRFCLSPPSISGMYNGVWNAISPFLPFDGTFPLPLDMGYLSLVGSNIVLLVVIQQRVAILELFQEKKSAHPSTTILDSHFTTYESKLLLYPKFHDKNTCLKIIKLLVIFSFLIAFLKMNKETCSGI